MKKIILTGGGSCGHIMPNIALLPELKKHYNEIYYIGEANSLEDNIAKQHNIKFIPTKAVKLDRIKIYKNIKIPFVLPCYLATACKIIDKIKPDIVFAKGGYVSMPICLACKIKKIPLVIHESDNSLGVTNKLCSKWAKKVITNNKELNKNAKFITIGNPIREELLNGWASRIVSALHIRAGKPNILIVGGSLGAAALNDIITTNIDMLVSHYNIIHICGKGKISKSNRVGYYPVEFADNIGDYYALADLIISRAGAGAIAEIQALGKRAILIPLPSSSSRGDQIENAKKSGITTIMQEDLCIEKLLLTIDQCFKSTSPKSNYDINTPKKIVDVILENSK